MSISNEAFGLLLIDNFFEKWQIFAGEDIEDTEPAQEAETGTGRGERKANTRRPGKYTKKRTLSLRKKPKQEQGGGKGKRTQEEQESTLKKN